MVVDDRWVAASVCQATWVCVFVTEKVPFSFAQITKRMLLLDLCEPLIVLYRSHPTQPGCTACTHQLTPVLVVDRSDCILTLPACCAQTSGQLSIVPMAGIAYSLWQVVTSTRSIVASETTAFVLGRIPYSIHFSWVGCAAILNLNTAIGMCCTLVPIVV